MAVKFEWTVMFDTADYIECDCETTFNEIIELSFLISIYVYKILIKFFWGGDLFFYFIFVKFAFANLKQRNVCHPKGNYPPAFKFISLLLMEENKPD